MLRTKGVCCDVVYIEVVGDEEFGMKWLNKIYLEFYFDTYVVSIKTRLFCCPIDRLAYDICRVRIEIFRHKIIEFDLYRRER